MPKKERTEAQKYGWYKSQLRKVWNMSPMYVEAMRRVTPRPTIRVCQTCKKEVFWKMVEVDHMEPCVAVNGITDMATFAARLNCPSDKLQVLCLECHQQKSRKENQLRREAK